MLPHLRSQRGMWTCFHLVRLDVSLELKVENLKETTTLQLASDTEKLMCKLFVYFGIYVFWNASLLHPLMQTCNLPYFVYPHQTKSLLMRSQK